MMLLVYKELNISSNKLKCDAVKGDDPVTAPIIPFSNS